MNPVFSSRAKSRLLYSGVYRVALMWFGRTLFICALLVLAWTAPTGLLKAQALPLLTAQLNHASWTIKEGAPVGIAAIQQDADGSLWLGSDQGLYNFDGFRFTSLESQPGSADLPTMPITAMFVDSGGALWVGFGVKGIAQIRDHRTVHLYGEADGLPPGSIQMITQSPGGLIVACARGRLVQLRNGHWSDLFSNAAFSTERIDSVFFDSSGKPWVTTAQSVWRPTSGTEFVRYVKGPLPFGASTATSPDGATWIALPNFNGSHKLTIEAAASDAVYRFATRIDVGANGVLFSRDGALWLTSDHGVQRVPSFSGQQGGHGFLSKVEEFGRVDGLTSNQVLRLFEDKDGNVWVATAKGLDRFSSPRLVPLIDSHLGGTDVSLTACPDGKVWVDTSGFHIAPLLSVENGRLRGHGIPRQAISLHCDSTGVLWLDDVGSLTRFDGKTFTEVPRLPGIARQTVGGRDALFASFVRNGLWRFNGKRWSRVSASGFPAETPYSIYLDSHGHLWTGYVDNRIAELEGDTGRVYSGEATSPIGIVESFLESSYGLLVGGTQGIAIVQGRHLHLLQPLDRSATRGASGLLEAANGDVWINGSSGIVCAPAREIQQAIHLPDYHFKAELFAEAGVTGSSPQLTAFPSAVRGADGSFWFSTSGNVVSIDPLKGHANTAVPILRRPTVSVDGRSLGPNEQIPAGYHTVQIKYFATYLTAPERVTYRYQLQGQDREWQQVGTSTETIYSGLRPGSYLFHVSASNGEGPWSTPDESVAFTVLPYFYQTVSFYVLCFCGLIGTAFSIIHLRVRAVTASVRKRIEIRADERVRIARDLHDTLLQGVQSLILRVHFAASELPEEHPTRVSLEHTLQIGDKVLLEGRDQVGQLRSDHLDGLSLTQAFENLNSEFNSEGTLRYSVVAEGEQRAIESTVQHELYYIGRESISNAFRHARASSIEVCISFGTKAVILSISDNGCGFSPVTAAAKARSGHFGLLGMKERARDIDGTWECSSAQGEGTRISVSVPVRRALAKKSAVTAQNAVPGYTKEANIT